MSKSVDRTWAEMTSIVSVWGGDGEEGWEAWDGEGDAGAGAGDGMDVDEQQLDGIGTVAGGGGGEEQQLEVVGREGSGVGDAGVLSRVLRGAVLVCMEIVKNLVFRREAMYPSMLYSVVVKMKWPCGDALTV